MEKKKSDEKIILTKEGYETLEKELKHLKTVKRKEVAEKINQALAFGDLSENAEYEEARMSKLSLKDVFWFWKKS